MADDEDYINNISRIKFEELCEGMFIKCIQPIDDVLAEAKISKKEIHEILLVGGSTRIPFIQKMVSDYFDGKVLNKSINPDEAVAYGAAI